MQNSLLDLILENDGIPVEVLKGEKYDELEDEGNTIYFELYKTLNDEQKVFLERYAKTQCELEEVSDKAHFKEGIKVGIRLALECLS